MSNTKNKQHAIGHAYDTLHIVPAGHNTYTVKTVTNDGYPAHSVLAGQPCIRFIDTCCSLEEAIAAYPDAEVTHAYQLPVNSVKHLPDDTDY